MSQRSAAYILALGVAAASVAGVTAYVMQPPGVGPAQAAIDAAELQISNRAAKADRRTTWLPDYSLYSTFSHFSSSLSLALALTAATPARHPIQGISNGLLNDAQIAGIENRLRLTPQQSERWPAVAAALRNIAAQHFQRRSTHKKIAPKIRVNSPEVQQLIEAALPLIQQLREDQKRELRQLVRIIGLDRIASLI